MAKKRGAKRQKVETSKRQKAEPVEPPPIEGHESRGECLEDCVAFLLRMKEQHMFNLEDGDASDLAIFIANEGTFLDRLEALQLLIPVARRVFDHKEADIRQGKRDMHSMAQRGLAEKRVELESLKAEIQGREEYLAKISK